jgi:2-dehydro-3-deoxyglucarate aldolase
MNRLAKLTALRATLAAGEPSVGSWMQISDASVAEIMGAAGYDWVAVDLEHGAIDVAQLPNLFRALELGATLPLVRVATADAVACKQALDAGAGGVILPMIESAEQLAEAVSHCRWPPAGTRGVGFSRGNLFGRRFAEYESEAQRPLVVAMIEHIRATERLDRILAVDGLDAVLIGPYDLSASMGLTACFDAPAFQEVMERIRVTCTRFRIPCGVHVVEPSPALLASRLHEGYRFLAYALDAVFLTSSSVRPSLATLGWKDRPPDGSA